MKESFDQASSSKSEVTLNPSDGRPFRLLRRPESSIKLKENVVDDDLQKSTKTLTLEEREAAYLEARKRIFGSHSNINEDDYEDTQKALPLIDDNFINQSIFSNSDTTLWMGDLKPDWDAKFIKDAFQQMSYNVKNVKMMFDRYGSKSSYCFIEFYDAETARSSMFNLSGKLIPNNSDGGKFNLSYANASNQSFEYNLFVSNLDSSIDDLLLFRTFGERYLSCKGAKIYFNSDGSSRKIGIVRFGNEADQQKALIEMNKFQLNNKEISLKIAQSKDRNYGKVYSYKYPYNEREPVRSGFRSNNITAPYVPLNISPNIVGAPIVSNMSDLVNLSCMNNNYSVFGYNIPHLNIPIQIPYGAPPPFLAIQYPALVPSNTNIEQKNESIKDER